MDFSISARSSPFSCPDAQPRGIPQHPGPRRPWGNFPPPPGATPPTPAALSRHQQRILDPVDSPETQPEACWREVPGPALSPGSHPSFHFPSAESQRGAATGQRSHSCAPNPGLPPSRWPSRRPPLQLAPQLPPTGEVPPHPDRWYQGGDPFLTQGYWRADTRGSPPVVTPRPSLQGSDGPRTPLKQRVRAGCHGHPASQFPPTKESSEMGKTLKHPRSWHPPAGKKYPTFIGPCSGDSGETEALGQVKTQPQGPHLSSLGGGGISGGHLKLGKGRRSPPRLRPLHPISLPDPELTDSLSIQHLGGHVDTTPTPIRFLLEMALQTHEGVGACAKSPP